MSAKSVAIKGITKFYGVDGSRYLPGSMERHEAQPDLEPVVVWRPDPAPTLCRYPLVDRLSMKSLLALAVGWRIVCGST